MNKLRVILSTILFSMVFAVPTLAASQPRDYDSNAVIYGGAYTVSELNSKLNSGTGQTYQTSAQLKALYAAYGIKQSDFGQLVDGYVTKNNTVVVNGKVVATNVTTMGRHYIAGSTKSTLVDYPIYLRHPSVSFLSESLPAFVSINYDGTYAYSIIKACGNIVIGPGVKTKPVTPVVTPVVTPKTPVVPTVVTTPVETTTLPTAGPVEAAAGAFALTISSGAGLAWYKSKQKLAGALRRVK